MATLSIKTRLEENGALILPKEAQEQWGLKPGDEVTISIEQNEVEASPVLSVNEQGLAVMQLLAERHKQRRTTDGSDTMRLLREARGGGAYGYDPTE